MEMIDNVVSLQARKNLKQLKKVDNDITQLLHYFGKSLVFLDKHRQYTGIKELHGRMQETRVILDLFSKRIKGALNGQSNGAS